MTNQEQTAEKQDHLLDEHAEAPKAAEQAVPAAEATDEAEQAAVVEAGDEAAASAEAEAEAETEQPLEQAVGGETMPSASVEPEADNSAAAEPANAAAESAVGAPESGMAAASRDAEAARPFVEPQLDVAPAPERAAEAEPAQEGQAAESGEPSGASQEASYQPVEEESGKPRRLKDLEADMELDGRVTSIALYGIFVDIGVGRDGLVHISEMSDTRIDSPSDLVAIGDIVKVRVKSVDPDARRISLTMRSKERPEGRGGRGGGRKRPEVDSERLASLKAGDTIEGTVTGLAQFGAFVDIGVGKDGLVHISELSEGRVDKPEDAVHVGERYTFKVLEVDPEGTRISLSLRKAMRGQRMQQLEKGAILDGTVSGLATFGAFVDIGVGRDGLVHISELSEGRVNRVEDAVQVGQKVQVRVLEVDPNSKRISLTMRLEDRPERPAEERPARTEGGRGEGGEGRAERPPRGETRSERPPRAERPPRPSEAAERVTVEDAEEPEESNGNATLEDLVSKFGGTGRKDKKRRQDEEEEEYGGGDRFSRRQRDAIRRTLQQMQDDE
jgi:predicted RNA-binding protein with RPS1 domain